LDEEALCGRQRVDDAASGWIDLPRHANPCTLWALEGLWRSSQPPRSPPLDTYKPFP
jgi:hypothetical protein